MNYIISTSTDVGNSKQTNQDSCYASVIQTAQGPMAFAVLCDGMGGLSQGEIASDTVVRMFKKWANDRLPVLTANGVQENEIAREWNYLTGSVNEEIKKYGNSQGIKLGTTLTAILLTQNRYYIINVGDTRAYEIGTLAVQLTKDHTLVEREVQRGAITAEQALIDPRRSILLQCIGASEHIAPDFFSDEILPDAVYMLCSDGFRHEISQEELFQYLNPAVMCSSQEMKQQIDELIRLNKERMEKDNITCVAIRAYC